MANEIEGSVSLDEALRITEERTGQLAKCSSVLKALLSGGWMSMESAPRNGTPILVKIRNDHPTVVTWRDNHWDLTHCGSYAGDGVMYEDIDGIEGWLPIPE
ncbi:MAG: hypothetical protein AAF571_12700 [Verrucomicrobiota bacterium]